MKIHLIDDTALLDTSFNQNVLKKETTILGRSNCYVNRLHVCGNARVNQENAYVGCGNNKLILGFNKKIQDVGFKNIPENQTVRGTSFKKQENVTGFQENQNQEKVSIGVGNERGMLGFEKNGKTIQVWVARGKLQDKYDTSFRDDKVSTIEMVELQTAKKTTISYSRKQMEDLRFLNIEHQNKNWGAIYCGLGPAVKKEYDGLLACNYPQQDFKKKVTAHGILGPMGVNGSWNHCYLRAPKNGLK